VNVVVWVRVQLLGRWGGGSGSAESTNNWVGPSRGDEPGVVMQLRNNNPESLDDVTPKHCKYNHEAMFDAYGAELDAFEMALLR
jgi:hypothetical protein